MKRYFYIDSSGKQKGTYSIEELRREHINRNTMVWTQGMEEWKRAYDVDDLQSLFDPNASQSSREQPQYAPGSTRHENQTPIMPRTWMLESILVTILPFLLCGNLLSLFGIIAIINASKVETLYRQELYTEAEEASAKAGRWTKITLWIIITAFILVIVAVLLLLLFFGSIAGIENALAV